MQAVDPARGMCGLVQFAEDPAGALKKDNAGIGQCDAARRAQEQFHSQPALQAGHHPRHRGLRRAELAGDLREAASLGSPNEHREFLKPITHTYSV